MVERYTSSVRFEDNLSCLSVKQYGKMLRSFVSGGVSELADEHDLGSCAERRRGSSPLFPTIN